MMYTDCYVLYNWSVVKKLKLCVTCEVINIIVYTAMVGLAATSSVYENLFHINVYNLNQLVTALIGSTVCTELYTISLIQEFKYSCLNVFVFVLYDSKNKLSIYLSGQSSRGQTESETTKSTGE